MWLQSVYRLVVVWLIMRFTYIVDVKVSGGYGIMKKDYKVAVAGTGYVGLSIATLLSQHNNRKSPILDDYIEKI